MPKALLTASLLLATLLLGAPQATAAPPTLSDQPDILTPADPPTPRPCEARLVSCDLTLATDSPTTDPPAPPPAEPTTTTATGTATSSAPATSSDPVAGSAGTRTPAGPAPDGANWWLIAAPVLALLALAAAGAFLAIQRTERRPS